MGYLDENGLQRYHSGIKTALANKADLDDIVALPNQAGTYILKAVSQNGTITYTWDTTKLTILRYGSSTWEDFIEAYSTNSIVYCRASSNTNPGTGLQGRMAFMAYLNSDTNPTNVEFQYYRSVNQHSATQQGDQMYVYKLDKNSGWSVTVRESYTKIVAGTKMSSSYSGGALTLNFDGHDLPSGGTAGQVLKKTSGTDYDVVWSDDSVGDIMVVTISGNPLVADKTYNEIAAALSNGKSCFANLDGRLLPYNPSASAGVGHVFRGFMDFSKRPTNSHIDYSTYAEVSITPNENVSVLSPLYFQNYNGPSTGTLVIMLYGSDYDVETYTFVPNDFNNIGTLSYQYTQLQTNTLFLQIKSDDNNSVFSYENFICTNVTIDYNNSQLTLEFANAYQTKTVSIVSGLYDYDWGDSTITVTSSSSSGLPSAPSTNGTYILKCVVSNGTPTYSWEQLQQASGSQF